MQCYYKIVTYVDGDDGDVDLVVIFVFLRPRRCLLPEVRWVVILRSARRGSTYACLQRTWLTPNPAYLATIGAMRRRMTCCAPTTAGSGRRRLRARFGAHLAPPHTGGVHGRWCHRERAADLSRARPRVLCRQGIGGGEQLPHLFAAAVSSLTGGCRCCASGTRKGVRRAPWEVQSG